MEARKDNPDHQAREQMRVAETLSPALEIYQTNMVSKLKAATLDGSPESERAALELVRRLQMMGEFENDLAMALMTGTVITMGNNE